MTEKEDAYALWATEQQKKTFEIFKDPFTDKIEPENEIAYLHTLRIGGSSDAALLGLSNYMQKDDVLDSFLSPHKQENKFVFDRGHAVEPFIASQFALLSHRKVTKGNIVYRVDRPWSMAQVDFFTEEPSIKDNKIPLEIKCVTNNLKDADGLTAFGKGCEFNSNGELVYKDDLIPKDYYIQCQKQMWFTCKNFMWLAVWITSETKIRVFYVERNDAIIQKIDEAEQDLIFNYVIPQKRFSDYAYKTESLEECSEDENARFADETFKTLCIEYRDKTAQKNLLVKQIEELREQIVAQMEDAHVVIDPSNSQEICKLTPQSRLTLDTKGLKDKYPDIVREFYHDMPITSKLTISKKWSA